MVRNTMKRLFQTGNHRTGFSKIPILLSLILFLCIPVLCRSSAWAAVIEVCGSGCGHSDVQSAIDEATDGDTIYIKEGTYPSFVVNGKSLTIEGEGAGLTIIDGNNDDAVVSISGGSIITLRDMTITNSGVFDAGVFIDQSTGVIEDCRIDNSGGDIYYGIEIGSGGQTDLTVQYTLIEGYTGFGIRLDGEGTFADIRYVTIDGGTNGSYGIRRYNGSAVINSSIISNNSSRSVYGISITVSYSYCYNSSSTLGPTLGPGNILTNETGPGYTDPDNGDFTLKADSPAIDKGDPHSFDGDESRSDMGYTGGKGAGNSILKVPLWFSSIHDAIEAAEPGDTIRVASGTYGDSIDFTNETTSPLTLEGGYDGMCTNRDVNVYETVVPEFRADGFHTGTVTIDGFTVTNSTSHGISAQNPGTSFNINNCKVYNNNSSGIYFSGIGTATISNCTIYNNGGYGGIYVFCEHTKVTIENNTIYAHSGPSNDGRGIIFYYANDDDLITGNTVYENCTGMYISASTVDTVTCVISNNLVHSNDPDGGSLASYGDGIYLNDGSMILRNNVVVSNARDGICYLNATHPVISNNVLANNGCVGVHFKNGEGNPIIDNNVFADNNRGLEFIEGSWGTSKIVPASLSYNCFHGPQAPPVLLYPSSYFIREDPSVWDDVNNLEYAEGNFLENPGFTDPDNYDYSLSPTSYLIDMGDPEDSFENEPEPNGNRINVGAYGNTSSAQIKPESPTVSNIIAQQEGDVVTIQFDTNTATEKLGIIAEYWDGTQYQPITIDSGLSNGRIESGPDRTITWNSSDIFSGQETPACKMRLTAARGNDDTAVGESVLFILDYKAPSISIVNPSTDAYPSTTPPSFSATASDGGSDISYIRFQYKPANEDDFIDLNTDTSFPYEANWGSVKFITGSIYHLRAVATDIKDNTCYSSSKEITVDPPTVDFSSSTYTGAEDGGPISVSVLLNGTSSETVTVNYASSTGTATGGVDYTDVAGSLTFNPGDTANSFSFTPTADSTDEIDETVILTLSGPSNAGLGTTNNPATLTIIDDDNPTVNFISASQSVAEDVNMVNATVTLSKVPSKEIIVPYTVTGTAKGNGIDHTLSGGNINIPAGQAAAELTLYITDDELVETDETIIVTMGMPANAMLGSSTIHTITVLDDDCVPAISDIADLTIDEDSTTGEIPFTVSDEDTETANLIVNASSSNISLIPDQNIIIGGSDANRTLTVTPSPDQSGTSTLTITVNDGFNESSKTFTITVTPLNDPPDAVDDSIATPKDEMITINVLSNDTDPDGDLISIETVTAPLNGSTTLNPDGTICYTPASGYSGADFFHYTISDGNGGQDTAKVLVTVTNSADISVTISNISNDVMAGDSLNCLITITNNGPLNATGVTMTGIIQNAAFLSSESSQGMCNESGNTIICDLGKIDKGKSVTVVISLMAIEEGLLSIQADVTCVEDDLNEDNNSDTAEVTVIPVADLRIDTTDIEYMTIESGETLSFKIQLINNGPSPASEIIVTDLISSGLGDLSGTPSKGAFETGKGVWNVGDLDSGETALLEINAVVTYSGKILNIASIMGSNLIDPDKTNNSAAIILNGGVQADLAIENLVKNQYPMIDDLITFYVKVANNGIDNATNIQVTDILQAGLEYESNSPSQGIYDPQTGVWDIGDLERGYNATLELTATANTLEELVNTANITHCDQFDPNNTNNASNATLNQDDVNHPSLVELAIQRTVNQDQATPGDEVISFLVVRNAGPDDANNIDIKDIFLSEGVSYISSEPSQGTYDIQTGIWHMETLPEGAYAMLTIVTDALNPGTFVDNAGIISKYEFDIYDENDSCDTTFTIIGTAGEDSEFFLHIQSSWNLLSFPLTPADPSVDGILSLIKEDIVSCWIWKDNNWAVYLPGYTDEESEIFLNSKGFCSMTEISCGDGFWLNTKNVQNLHVTGTESPDISYFLNPGWHLIGLKSNQGRYVADFVAGKEGSITSIWKWENNNWTVYLPGLEDNGASYTDSKGFQLLDNINPGEGFWINVKEEVLLEPPD